MSSTTEIVLNSIFAVFYYITACVTNSFLLQRLENLHQEHLRDRRRQLEREVTLQKRRGGASNATSSRSLGRQSGGAVVNMHSGSHLLDTEGITVGRMNVDISPVALEVEALLGEEEFQASVRGVGQYGFRVFRDYVCMFFVLLIIFTLSRVICVTASNLIVGSAVSNFGGSRNNQDTFVFPSTFFYYLVPLTLLHTFYYLADAADPKPNSVYRMRVGVSFVIYAISSIGTFILQVLGYAENASEYFGVAISCAYAVFFAFTAVFIPKKLERYGESITVMARKVRIVSSLLAISFFLRGVFLVPPLQNFYSRVSLVSLTVYLILDLFPTAASLFILHMKDQQQQQSVPSSASSSYLTA